MPFHSEFNILSTQKRFKIYFMESQSYYSNGKLLITGEYAVLEGALSLALPTKFGQELNVFQTKQSSLVWESFTHTGACWFQTKFDLNQLASPSEDPIENTLKQILFAAQKINPSFLKEPSGVKVQTRLSFPNNWGLGTSSTLINNIAAWAKVDAFELLQNSFGGSGYDIACAQENTPIHYQRAGGTQKATPISFEPTFSEHLYFVYLNQKQDSKEGIRLYKSMAKGKETLCVEISEITKKISKATTLNEFETLLIFHEQLIAKALRLTPVKERLFGDYLGAVKSLGAWGGDFVLATGDKTTPAYFKEKGYSTVLTYKEMIL